MDKKQIKLIIGVNVFIIAVLVLMVVIKVSSAKKSEETTEAFSNKNASKDIGEEQNMDDALVTTSPVIDDSTILNWYIQDISNKLKKSFEYNYEINTDDLNKTITVNVWMEGFAEIVELIILTPTKEVVDNWLSLKMQYRNFASDLYNEFKEYKITDMHLVFNIINDIDHEKIIVSWKDSVEVYNFLALVEAAN